MTNIALSGYIGSGKTTISQRLVERYGYIRMGFADVLKDELAAELGIPVQDLYTEGVKEQYRTQMQALGSGRRESDYHYWVRKFIEKFNSSEMQVGVGIWSKPTNVIVDDMRYPNELVALARLGFSTVRLDCPYEDVVQYLRGKGKTDQEIINTMNHESETSLEGEQLHGFFDYVIYAPRSKPIDSIMADIIYKVMYPQKESVSV